MKKKIMKEIGFILLAFIWMFLSPASVQASSIPESGSLTIHKYVWNEGMDAGHSNAGNEWEALPSGAVPVEGTQFTIWQVDTSGNYRPESAADARGHLLTDTMQSVLTDEEGKAVFPSLTRGLYYIEETGASEQAENLFPSQPFLAEVPMTDPTGEGWITDVHVYLKTPSMMIDKFVGGAGDEDYNFTDLDAAKNRPVALSEKFGWSILSSIPSNLGKTSNESYVVTDDLSEDFAYNAGSVKVYSIPTMDTSCKSGLLLIEGDDYTLVFDSAENKVTVSLTAQGMSKINERYQDSAINDRYLIIKFDCTLTSQAAMGVDLYSGAEVAYSKDPNGLVRTRSVNTVTATSKVALEPEVHSGQVGIKKVDSNNHTKTLEGAVFGIALSKEDAQNGRFIATGTTDKDGLLDLEGLSYGAPGDNSKENSSNTTYWLMETTAPEGYELLKEPVEVKFQFQEDESNGENYFAMVTVYNEASAIGGGKKPGPVQTGDTAPLAALGALMLFSMTAGIYIWRKKKAD